MERREALAAYNDAYKEQDDLYRAVARQCGLSDCAFWVLYALRESGRPMTQSDVCAAVYQPKQTVHSALKKLAGEGYLQLTEGRDRRSKYLTLTAAGDADGAHRRPGDGGGGNGHGHPDGGGTDAVSGAVPPLQRRAAAGAVHGHRGEKGVNHEDTVIRSLYL